MSWYKHIANTDYVQCTKCDKGYLHASIQQLKKCPNCSPVNIKEGALMPTSKAACVCCGAHMQEVKTMRVSPFNGWYYVECMNCGYSMPPMAAYNDAVAAWNKKYEENKKE